MGLNAMGLGFVFNAVDLASGVMGNIEKNLKGLEDASGKTISGLDGMIKGLGAGLAATAVGVGGIAASFKLAQGAGDFEQALANVGAVSNATAEELQELRKAAIQAGKDTQFSPTKAVEALNELAQAGYDTKESIALLKPTLALAAGSLGDLSPAEAAGLASQGLKAFGIDAKLAGREVDQLLQSANAFAVKPKDLALGLGTAAGGAQTLNQSLTETVIAFGLVKNVIPGTERAATAVKVAMERLANPKVQLAMRAHHVAVTDANGGYRQFLDIVKDLMPQLDKMSEKDRSAFLLNAFGTEGLGGVNAMLGQFESGIKGADGQIRKGGDAIDYLRKQFAGANGVAEDFAKKTLNTYNGAMTLLGGSMETLGIQIGEPFRDVLRPAIEGVTVVVNGIIDALDNANPTVLRFAAGLFLGAAVLLTLLGVGLLISAGWPLVVAGFELLSGALWEMAAAAVAALIPLWPFVLAGIAIAGIVYAIKNNLGGLGGVWDNVTEKFSAGGKVLGAVFDTVVNYAKGLWDALSSGFSEVFAEFDFDELSAAIGTLMAAFSDLGDNFDDTTSGPGSGMLSFVKFLGSALGDLVSALMWVVKWAVIFGAAFVEIISGVAAFVKPIILGITDALGAWAEWIGNIVDTIVGAWDVIASFLGLGTTSGTRGLTVDHKGDAAGKATTRGLGATPAASAKTDGEKEKKPAAEPEKPAAGSAAQIAALAAKVEKPAPIDYEKLADANANRPLNVSLNVDGEKIAAAVLKGQRDTAARQATRDVGER